MQWVAGLINLYKRYPVLKTAPVAILGFTLSIAVWLSGPLNQAELSSVDYRFRNFSHPENADTSILIVAIDQKTLDFFEEQGITWPFPREFYGVALDYLGFAESRGVLFDIDFSSVEADKIEISSAESEKTFADALESYGNAYLIHTFKEGTPDSSQRAFAKRHFYNLASVVHPSAVEPRALLMPLNAFSSACRGSGFADLLSDPDGIFRKVPLAKSFEGRFSLFAPFALYAGTLGYSATEIDSLLQNLPLDNDKSLLVNWYGKAGVDQVFRYISFHSLLVSAYKQKNGLTPDIDPAEFRNKFVLFGGTAIGLLDYRPFPVSGAEKVPGVELHAVVLSNLLKNDFARPSGRLAELVSILVMVLLSSLLLRVSGKVVYISLLQMALAAVYISLILILFDAYRVVLPVVLPLFSLLMVSITGGLSLYAAEGKKKREMKKVFTRYVSPHVIDDLIKNPASIDFEGKETEATIFFSDIKDFTSIAEKMSARELVRMLNQYLELCSSSLMRHEAMIDKYIGDAIMALFGVVSSGKNHAVQACFAAIQLQKDLQEFNIARIDRKEAPLSTRIGLNTGKIVVGNIGSPHHLDYTAIGDTVNLASRLEGINKVYGTSIIISDSVYEVAKEEIEARELDLIAVKGREEPVRIYELIGEKGSVHDDKQAFLLLYHRSLELFRGKRYEEALAAFDGILRKYPDDIPSGIYKQRAFNFLNGIAGDAHGVTRMKEK